MPAAYSLRKLISALDPIAEWQPQGLRDLARRIRWLDGVQGAGPLSYRMLQRTVGGNGLRQSLHAIDAADPPRSLRQAYQRLEFPLGNGITRLPLRAVSMRQAARRIHGPRVAELRFLSYNTYLLPGLQIPFGRWIDDTVGWDALSWFGIPLGGALLGFFGLANIPGFSI